MTLTMSPAPQDELYKKLFSEMVDGFALHEAVRDQNGGLADYRFLEVNRAFERITSLLSSSIVGRTVRDVFPESGAFMMELFEKVTATGAPQTFERFARDLGTHLKITAYCPSPDMLACIVADITENKRIEAALRESESTFRAHVENSFDVIFTLDATGTFVFVSPAWERHFGYPVSEVMGHSFAPFVHPDDVQPCIEYLTWILTTGRSGTSPVYRVKCADGSLRSFVANGMPYTDTKGELLFIGVGHDVTDQLQAEQERLDFERQLLHTQKLESLGVLAGGIAHDFNNLLLTILGNVELAALKIPPDSPPHKLLEQATLAATRAADLTSRLLAYSGKGVFVITRLNLNQLVNENATLFRTAVPRTVSIDMHLSEGIPDIMGDVAQIQQVIMNLITNASEAIEIQAGRIKLSTGLVNCDRICLSKSRLEEKPEPGRFVYLEVSDNGAGMAEKIQQQIFDPFFTTKFTGRGLGMSAVLGIVKAHSGALFLDSAPGRGTTIRVIFPTAEKASMSPGMEAAHAEIVSDVSDATSGTVLIVDDEKSVLKICAAMVTLCGFSTITASDGAEAVETFRLRSNEIDLVLMDLTMPNMDGVAAMQELRRIKPEIRIILSSGFNEQELDERISNQNPSGFIRKPYSLKSLEAELRRVMQEKPI
ncbi:MAG: PAS domain S-box protein [Pelobacteraceae bacterium]